MPLEKNEKKILIENRIPKTPEISEAKKITLAKEDALRHGLKETDTAFEVVFKGSQRKNVISLEHLDRKIAIIERRKKQIINNFEARVEEVKTLRNDLAKRG